jgi:predicted dehydrogenase
MSGLDTSDSSLSVALIGFGRWAQHVARDLSACGVRVIAVCRSEQSAKRAEDSNHVGTIVRSVAELPEVAGAVVCTPTSVHADAVEKLAGLHVPVFVEKPMTNEPSRAEQLVSLMGDRLFVMDKWRYHPGIEEMGRIARGREFGDAIGLRTIRRGGGVSHDDVDAVWVLAPHELAIGLEILGRRLDPDCSVVVQRDGWTVSMTAILGGNPWQTIEVSSIAAAHERSIELICETAIISLPDPYADHLAIRPIDDPTADPRRAPISTEMPLFRELQAFVDYLRGQGPVPRSTAEDGLWIVRTIGRLREIAVGG